MLIRHPDLKPEENYEYYFIEETTEKYCMFATDKEMEVGSVIVIEDYLDSTNIFKIASIKEVHKKKVVEFEEFEVVRGFQNMVKLDDLEW